MKYRGLRVRQFYDRVLAHDGGVGFKEGVEGFFCRVIGFDIVPRQAEQLPGTRDRRPQVHRGERRAGLALRGFGDAGANSIPTTDYRFQLRLGTGCADTRYGGRHVFDRVMLDYAEGIVIVVCQFHESLLSTDGLRI